MTEPGCREAPEVLEATETPSRPSSAPRADLLQQWISPGATLYVNLGHVEKGSKGTSWQFHVPGSICTREIRGIRSNVVISRD